MNNNSLMAAAAAVIIFALGIVLAALGRRLEATRMDYRRSESPSRRQALFGSWKEEHFAIKKPVSTFSGPCR
jgi:hypothetical protein